jgi:hypothetical protein
MDEVEVICPECVAGKHQNCTHEVLVGDDDIVLCGCEQAGHD